MNLIMINPKIETKDLLSPITKNCETIFKQNHKNHKKRLILNLPNQ